MKNNDSSNKTMSQIQFRTYSNPKYKCKSCSFGCVLHKRLKSETLKGMVVKPVMSVDHQVV